MRRSSAPSGGRAIQPARGRSTGALLLGAVLASAVVAAHVGDQGGLLAFTTPDWMGWAYRALELAGTVVCCALLARVALRFTWCCAFLVGLGPFVGYVLTRTTGLPRARDDIGNWTDPLGLASLVVEFLLMIVSLVALTKMDSRRATIILEPVYPVDHTVRSAVGIRDHATA